ncbi:hypothetical protein [Eremococcus coleocola]|nr:hypothetical protein [Eremococcus coleocola]
MNELALSNNLSQIEIFHQKGAKNATSNFNTTHRPFDFEYQFTD